MQDLQRSKKATEGLVPQAYWLNGGTNPAESTVRNWKLLSRKNVSGSRHFANMPDVNYTYQNQFGEILALIKSTKEQVLKTINTELIDLKEKGN